jgi:rubredoxin
MGDPEAGIGPGIVFEELPDSWGCPDCGSEKEFFEQCEDDGSLPEDTYN